ncbi:MAG TPA: aminotransferase [Candidatus Latescibacteria bacterium]|jgi:selenocysteine lyase/cysteine desulfurase|nr:aminotransferase [Candidatus Latescibacterota bacterium]
MFDLHQIRQEFPVVNQITYLNHAAVGTISRRVRSAVEQYVKDFNEFAASHYAQWDLTVQDTRRAVAQLIHAEADDIALVKNTSEGICFAANGIDWHPGENVIVNDMEFPSNVLPWLNLTSRDVETRFVKSHHGRIVPEDIHAMIDDKTRVVAISHVEFGNGFRNDIGTIGAICREKGVYFVVDAIQSLGQVPINVIETPVDILTADAHKWLLGPEGIGVFYCAPHMIERLHLYEVGWHSIKEAGDYDSYDPTPAATAQRFECGALNTMGIYALKAAVDLLLEVGVENIQDRLLLLTSTLIDHLQNKGYRIVSPRGKEEWSGIVTFMSDRYDTESLHLTLRSKHIIGAKRGGGIRISPHFYNTEEEVLRVVDALPEH